MINPGTIIVAKHDEQSLEKTRVTSSDDLMNGNQTLIGEDSRKLGSRLDEGISSGSRTGSSGGWEGLEQRTRLEPSNLVGRPRTVGLLVLTAELMQDADADSSLNRDLVSKADALESGREMNW